MFNKIYLSFIKPDRERLLHGLKTALACLLGFVVTKLIHLPVEQWLIITIIIVMCAQINVGSILQKSYVRFFGTLLGSLVSLLALLFLNDNLLGLVIIICLTVMVFSYLATGESRFSDAGTLGAVTTVIILVGPHPTLLTAVFRFLEIGAGVGIAALFSQFVFPIHAWTHLQRSQADTIKRLQNYYEVVIVKDSETADKTVWQELDENIIKALITQRKLAKEAGHETFVGHFDQESFKKILQAEKEILRSINFMRHIYNAAPNVREILAGYFNLLAFNDFVMQSLQSIAERLENSKSSNDNAEFKIGFKIFGVEGERALYVNTFLFCAELLLRQLSELFELVNEI